MALYIKPKMTASLLNLSELKFNSNSFWLRAVPFESNRVEERKISLGVWTRILNYFTQWD